MQPWETAKHPSLYSTRGQSKLVLKYRIGNKDETDLSDIDLGTGDNWASQRGTQEVDILVDGVASNGGEAQLLNKLPYIPWRQPQSFICSVIDRKIHTAEVDNFSLDGTKLQSLLLDSVEVL